MTEWLKSSLKKKKKERIGRRIFEYHEKMRAAFVNVVVLFRF